MRNFCLCLILLTGITTACDGEHIQFRVTNYQPTKKQCGSTKGITHSGHKLKYGLCAADIRYYPMGTVIKLDTGERLVVADTGSKIKGRHHIDRANPYNRIFPVTSRGMVLYWGNRKLPKYKAVVVGLQVRHKLKLEALRKRGKSYVQRSAIHDSSNWRYTGIRPTKITTRSSDGLCRWPTTGPLNRILSQSVNNSYGR